MFPFNLVLYSSILENTMFIFLKTHLYLELVSFPVKKKVAKLGNDSMRNKNPVSILDLNASIILSQQLMDYNSRIL